MNCLSGSIKVSLSVILVHLFLCVNGQKLEAYSVWKNSLNESASPCSDFYQFTCGNYKSKLINSEDDGAEKDFISELVNGIEHGSAMKEAGYKNEECLKKAIYGNNETNSTAIIKMRQFRDAMSENKDVEFTSEQMIKEMKMIGGCPGILGSQDFNPNFDIADALFRLKLITGNDFLFDIYGQKLSNSNFVLAIKPENKTIENYALYLDSNQTVSWKFNMERSDLYTELLKLALNKKQPNMALTEISPTRYNEWSNKLANISRHVLQLTINSGFYKQQITEMNEYGFELPYVDDSRYDKIRFNELSSLFTFFNVSDYILRTVQFSPKLIAYLNENPIVYLNTKQLLSNLNNYYSSLDSEAMANYLCSFYLLNHKDRLEEEDDESGESESDSLEDKLDMLKLGIIPNASNETVVVGLIKIFMGFVSDYLFVNECADANALKEVARMVDEIQSASIEMISKQVWLDPETKSRAIQKLNETQKFVGAVDTALDLKKLDEHYEKFHVNSNDGPNEILVNFLIFIEQTELSRIVNPIKSADAPLYRASIINAVNFYEENTISIYAGYLFPPNFNINQKASINYGAVGMMISHEIWHSLGPVGNKFDSNGIRKDWWTAKSYDKFKQRAQCFIDQYAHGTRTLDENLSDNNGLRAAYYAYKRQLNGSESANVSGYEQYTNDQAFFISFGTMWCDDYNPYIKSILLSSDTHSLSNYRVNNPLKNFDKFSQAFNCPLGSSMNPMKKCEMW